MEAPALRDAMLGQITLARAEQELDAANEALRAASCTTINRAAMFLSQLGHESGSLRYNTELASGEAYNGRKDLGNTRPGDGPLFKGRSYIQVTGAVNYLAVGKWAHDLGLVSSQRYFYDNPLALAQTRWAWMAPVWYWTVARPQINKLCDAGDLTAVTRVINGGTHGLADRARRWAACKALGARLLPVPAVDDPAPRRRRRALLLVD